MSQPKRTSLLVEGAEPQVDEFLRLRAEVDAAKEALEPVEHALTHAALQQVESAVAEGVPAFTVRFRGSNGRTADVIVADRGKEVDAAQVAAWRAKLGAKAGEFFENVTTVTLTGDWAAWFVEHYGGDVDENAVVKTKTVPVGGFLSRWLASRAKLSLPQRAVVGEILRVGLVKPSVKPGR